VTSGDLSVGFVHGPIRHHTAILAKPKGYGQLLVALPGRSDLAVEGAVEPRLVEPACDLGGREAEAAMGLGLAQELAFCYANYTLL
jgi:hypothetical protein